MAVVSAEAQVSLCQLITRSVHVRIAGISNLSSKTCSSLPTSPMAFQTVCTCWSTSSPQMHSSRQGSPRALALSSTKKSRLLGPSTMLPNPVGHLPRSPHDARILARVSAGQALYCFARSLCSSVDGVAASFARRATINPRALDQIDMTGLLVLAWCLAARPGS